MWLKPRDSRRAERKTPGRKFWGCSNFPKCTFTQEYAAGPLQFAMAEHADNFEQQE
jgi:ssDNA-binding Zn-finger/Zn-ribbon topoisomerase 1